MRPSSIVQSGMPSGEKWVRSNYNQICLRSRRSAGGVRLVAQLKRASRRTVSVFFYKLLVVFEQC